MIVELILPDMTCGHCVKTVTATAQAVDPAARLQIDLPAHKVQIDSAVAAERFVQALTDEGYPPQV